MTSAPTGTRSRTGDGSATARRGPTATLKVTRRVRVLLRPVDGGHAVGRDAAQPAPPARIPASTSPAALAVPGVFAVLTHEDVPGEKPTGWSTATSPCSPTTEVRYQGEPVALVAADHPETARRAAAAIVVDYEELPAGHRPRGPARPRRRPSACTRARQHRAARCRIRRGDPPVAGRAVVVTGEYEVGMQDQAFLGPGVRARGARRGRRRRPVRRDPVAARRPRPGGHALGLAEEQGAADAGRRRRGVRRREDLSCRCTRACWRCAPAGR